MVILTYIILGLSSLVVAFINLSPQFGANPDNEQKQYYSSFSNYNNNEFNNLEETVMVTGEMPMSDFFVRDSNRTPEASIASQNIDINKFKNNNIINFSWLGHSGFIFNINGTLIMLDPMLGEHASPVPIPTLKRYSEIPLSFENIEMIDAVIFSHDHYDHLDYPTIKKLSNKVKRFFVPLGLGNHLESWGVDSDIITELNWNQSFQFGEINFICLPSRHFSGRGPFNRNSTLWASWAIISSFGKIYFSGDSGYGKHFKDVGEEHGPFDIVLIDSGQYNEAWRHSHMFPEEAVLAAKDLKAKYFMPIHWGTFTLSTHAWNEPINQSIFYAKKYNQHIIAPEIGEVVFLNNINDNVKEWWIR